jgi:hypothetical protein
MSKFYPVEGQKYYMINSRFEVAMAIHNGSNKSKMRIDAGNAFKKHSDALRFQQGMLGLKESINKKWWEFWK